MSKHFSLVSNEFNYFIHAENGFVFVFEGPRLRAKYPATEESQEEKAKVLASRIEEHLKEGGTYDDFDWDGYAVNDSNNIEQPTPPPEPEPTLGPWEIGADNNIQTRSRRTGNLVAIMPCYRTEEEKDEIRADALLIAAAGTAASVVKRMGYNGRAAVMALPLLLQACEAARALGTLDASHTPAEVKDMLDNALAKARGGK